MMVLMMMSNRNNSHQLTFPLPNQQQLFYECKYSRELTNRLLFCYQCRVDDELKKNLGTQKAENVKLQNQIGQLKAEKTQLQQNLIGLQRRIGELELSIGAEGDGTSV